MYGERIKRLREKHKLTQKAFGQRIGLASSTISMIERDERNPTISTIKKISSEFNVACESICYTPGEKASNSEMTEKEIDVLNSFSELSQISQDKVYDYIKMIEFWENNKED